MYNNNIYYLHIQPYNVSLNKNIILNRLFLITNNLLFKNFNYFKINFKNYKNNNTTITNLNNDQLFNNIKQFFILGLNYSR